MSYGPSTPSPSHDVLATYDSLAINSYARVASAAFILYECSITFDQEVEMFWKETFSRRKLTGATALFLVNRYLVLILRLANLLGFVPMTDKKCALATKVALGFTLLQYIPWAVFAGMRAYALSRNKLVSALIFALSMTTTAVNLSLYPFGFTGYFDPIFGCTVIDPIPLDLSRKFVIICRTCFILADVLLILITWLTISWKGLVDSMNRKDVLTLAEVMLRNGTTYFAALLVLHILHLTLSLCSIHVALQSLSYGYVTIFTEVVEAALVSRFLLDLQTAHRQALDEDAGSEVDVGPSDTVVFRRRTVGSVGSVGLSSAWSGNGDWDQVAVDPQVDIIEEADACGTCGEGDFPASRLMLPR